MGEGVSVSVCGEALVLVCGEGVSVSVWGKVLVLVCRGRCWC